LWEKEEEEEEENKTKTKTKDSDSPFDLRLLLLIDASRGRRKRNSDRLRRVRGNVGFPGWQVSVKEYPHPPPPLLCVNMLNVGV
jgi:hypothetical protein